MDRFSSACLLLAVMLLAVIAIRPILAPQAAEAAHRYKYLVVAPHLAHEAGRPPITVQDDLNKYSAEGWEFVAFTSDWQCIFKK
jgi:hypothetical protein